MNTIKSFTIILFLLVLTLVACQSNSSLQANAGSDFSIKVGESPTFEGCASTGEIVNYKWVIIESPDKMADDVGKVIREVDQNCSFTLDENMGVDEVGPWTIELQVRDASDNSSTDTVRVEVTS